MAKNTGKVREKSGNFVSPEKWEPCIVNGSTVGIFIIQSILQTIVMIPFDKRRVKIIFSIPLKLLLQ